MPVRQLQLGSFCPFFVTDEFERAEFHATFSLSAQLK